MKNIRKISSILMVMMLILSMGSVFAAESTVTFKGLEEGFVFAPGSGYTDTDLFDGFKNVMPGDKLTEEIVVVNDTEDCDFINVYMKAVAHDEEENPLTYDEAYENLDGKDQAKVEGTRDETVATMEDFLAQLSLKVYNGAELIEESDLSDFVYLGTLVNGEDLKLNVELEVPITMGNEYANRVGEVDWVFHAEAIQFDTLTVKKVWDDDNSKDRPESVKVNLLGDGEVVETVVLSDENDWTYTWETLDDRYTWSVEEVVPKDYSVSYRVNGEVVTITNTTTLIFTGQVDWPVYVLGTLGVMMMFLGIIIMRKKKENENV
ncbi:MAG: Cna B-type domain-containing protein [Anaerofustis stercorihominis]|nr:Cna B-type domain-containing protein [Anaerofustis stercorihominis]